MTIDSYQGYGLVLADVWEQGSATLVTRPADDGRSGILLGADRSGHRHLMAPIVQSLAVNESKGDSLEIHDTTVDGQRYLDLVCTSDGLAHVFATLADQVVRRAAASEVPPFQVLQTTIGEWRALLKPAPALTEDEARGLFGELCILRLLAGRNPGYALDSWTGPDGEQHDFTTGQGDIEVKSSRSAGRSITVSSLQQLDPPSDRPLLVARLQIENTPNGRNIRDMVEDLCEAGLLHEELVAKLAGARYLFGDDPDTHRFAVVGEPEAWLVGDDFPGLRASDIPPRRLASVRGVKYTVDLSVAGDPMTEEEFVSYLDGLMRS